MVAALAMLSVLNACGNKGALKLPEKASATTIGRDMPAASTDDRKETQTKPKSDQDKAPLSKSKTE